MSESPALPPLPEIELGTYRHYNGSLYELIGIGYHSETLVPHCAYVSAETGDLWFRPAEMWSEMVLVPRFKKVD